MEQVEIFEGIENAELDRMLCCFRPEYKLFSKGDAILFCSVVPEHVCVLLSGHAHLYSVDNEGETLLLEEYEQGDIFGDIFSMPYGGLGFIVEADLSCEVMFLRFETICGRCEKACEHHSQLTTNMFKLSARRAQSLALRVSLLSRKTVRQRLWAYFLYTSERCGSSTFDAGVSWSRLSEYLCADRSSLMRELRALRDEGAIETHGRLVTLLQ